MRFVVDGQMYDVKDWRELYPGVVECDTDVGEAWILAEDSETAGKAAREYWEDLSENDPQEMACIIGLDVLIKWGLGQYAGPGYTAVSSLKEWLDLWLDTPEEHFASYDGTEYDIERVGKLCKEIGFIPTVAYRRD